MTLDQGTRVEWSAQPGIRAVCLTPGYAPAATFGGPIESAHGLNRALLAQGVQVRVLTTDIGQAPEKRRADGDGWDWHEGIPVRYCRRYWPGSLSPAFAANVPDVLAHADIAHIAGTFAFTPLVGALACLSSGTPFVVSPRGTLEPWCLAHKRWKKMPALALLRPLLNRATAIHATSEKEAMALLELRLDPPVVVIPNGVDLSATSGIEDCGSQWRERLGVPRDAPLLLMLGRIHYVKGIDIALEALVAIRAKWRQAVLALVGPDSEGYGTTIDNLAERLGIASAVKRVGFVGGTEKFQLLAEADLLLLPSRQENFGNVVVEALSMRTPVVASSNTPWKGLEEHQCGRWGAFDAVTLAEAVNELLSEPGRRKGMGERGRALVARQYTWGSIAESMRQVYAACIAGERPLPHEFCP